jgi:hypothetical protein
MKPNLTLMSSLVVTAKDGKKGISRGFWGDAVTGPFVAFGHQVKSKVVEAKMYAV